MTKKFFLFFSFIFGLTCSDASAQTSFAPLAEKVIPMVVNISTRLENTHDSPDILNNLLFETPDGRVALGSGFIFSSDGYIATNFHVIEKAAEISVTTSSGTTYSATLSGIDKKTDIALIKIEPKEELTPVIFGNSDDLKIGDWILAVGNPFGLGSSVTAGIVSAKSRNINSGPYDNYIQTDASINQGNSGGPMFDMNGHIIGINTAIFSKTGNSVGVGFALPSNEALWVLNQLKEKGKVERSWLGITVKNITIENKQSVIIDSLLDEKIAEKDLLVGDVILEINEKPISDAKDFSWKLSQMPPFSDFKMKIWRDGKIIEKQLKTLLMTETNTKQTDTRLEQGLCYTEIGLCLNESFIITTVDKNKEAFSKGVQKGDKLIKAFGEDISSHDEIRYQIENAILRKTPIRLDFKNVSGNTYFIKLTPQK